MINVSEKHKVQIAAEISGNHGGDMEKAMHLISLAAEYGADMVKIQTYTEDSLTIDSKREEFLLKEGLWKGYTFYDLYKKAKTPREWMQPLFDFARSKEILLFSSPFSFEDVDVLEKAGCPVYKIASFELNYPQLIKYCASTGKAMVISTGGATLEEIDRAVESARDGGCKDLTVLHCESRYPAAPETFNLRSIPFFKERYGCKSGLSNHSIGDTLDIAAAALGADMIEKHFALNRDDGIDAAFSMTPDELRQLKADTSAVSAALGEFGIRLNEEDLKARTMRRSVYLIKDLEEGESLSTEHVKIIRPANGLEPYRLDQVLGKKAAKALKSPLPLNEKDFV